MSKDWFESVAVAQAQARRRLPRTLYNALVAGTGRGATSDDNWNAFHELELLPVLIACMAWGHFFEGSQIVYYIDNESARMAYIRGDGETILGNKIVSQFVELESQRQHRVWFGRVPSHSNLADGPSRLCFEAVQKLGAVRTSVDWEGTAEHLGI